MARTTKSAAGPARRAQPTRAELKQLQATYAEALAAKDRIIESLGRDLANARRAIDDQASDVRRFVNRLHEAERTIISQAHEIAAHRRFDCLNHELNACDRDARG